MTIFDLLFIGIFLGSVGMLIVMLVSLLRGRVRQAGKLLAGYALGLALYLGIVAVVGLVSPARRLAPGQERCFDDWCISVKSAQRAEAQGQSVYTVEMQLKNSALRATQRENGVVVYLQDSQGRRYPPMDDSRALPFNALLQPGETLVSTRIFTLPQDAGPVALALEHEGGRRFPGVFIIGDDSSLFHKATMMELP